MNKTLILSLLLSITSISHASRWHELQQDDVKIVELDLDSLQNVGTQSAPIAKAWLKLTPFQGDKKLQLSAGEYTQSLQLFDCTRKRIRYLQFVFYTPNGRVKRSLKSADSSYDDVIPESTGDETLITVCKALATTITKETK